MKLNRKDRKIETQQNIINRLEEENEILRQQLEARCLGNMESKETLAGQAYREYTGLIEELNEMKQEYVELIKEMAEMKEKMKRKCK
ncbi:hypothetical protein C806_01292 [Lachnospiraceae bacterium 3-1]|nr:hypothetical protein C806_01292 [Lachnospiraceae bacterium 3-1]